MFAGADAAFSVTASGTDVIYRWQRSPDGSSWSDLDGGTAATLALSQVAIADDGARFRVIVANALGAATSGAAQLHVTPAPAAPTFSAMPGDLTVVAAQAASFSVRVSGVPAPTLAWQVSTDGELRLRRHRRRLHPAHDRWRRTWTTVYTPAGFHCLSDVSAPSRSVAVVAGCAGDLMRTSDGGATWQDVAIPSATADFGKAWFVSSTEGFVAGDQEYWHTDDGGASWTLEAINWSACNGVALDAHTSLAFGGHGSLARRSN